MRKCWGNLVVLVRKTCVVLHGFLHTQSMLLNRLVYKVRITYTFCTRFVLKFPTSILYFKTPVIGVVLPIIPNTNNKLQQVYIYFICNSCRSLT